MYYHYINKEILKDKKQEDRIAYGTDLWETSSLNYANINEITRKITKDKKFELITLNKVKSNIDDINLSEFIPKIGDLLVRRGNVEFYIGHNKTIGWGIVHKTNVIKKEYQITENGIISNELEDDNIPFTTIIRFVGYSNEK